ncbi:DUF6461 domain-containing protein [Streptomyces globosus]|uniref:DUF6461 domain-containing protein n=1 Tax=Streptomyces globosus TaxID=68209 RepID=UPI0037F9F607
MTSVTAQDYASMRSSRLFCDAMTRGYGMVLVRGIAPTDVLRLMEAEPQGTGEGLDALVERHEEHRDGTDYWDDSFVAGACTVSGTDGDWTLVFAFDGSGGMSRFLPALSRSGRAVSHSTNGGKPIDLFDWYEDGELRVGFERPACRYGSRPDELVEMMREIGFDLAEDGNGTGAGADTKAGVLALSEQLTGVRLTEELLTGAEYYFGHVPEQPAE